MTRTTAGSAKLKYQTVEDEGLKLDLGTGKGFNKPEGFIGVDIKKSPAVDKVCDLTKKWPWKDGEVTEINCNHVLQYLTAKERLHVVNEAYRVLKTGGKMVVIVPHWCASKAYADIETCYPPVSEAWFQMLHKAGREAQNWVIEGYKCDFDFTLGYVLHPAITPRATEYQQNAVNFYKEAAQDIAVTLLKR